MIAEVVDEFADEFTDDDRGDRGDRARDRGDRADEIFLVVDSFSDDFGGTFRY
jgi:hypothetical protein